MLERIEVCAPPAFFWKAVCPRCDEQLFTGQSALMVATSSLGCHVPQSRYVLRTVGTSLVLMSGGFEVESDGGVNAHGGKIP